jgi:hypothetical protein
MTPFYESRGYMGMAAMEEKLLHFQGLEKKLTPFKK